MAAKPDFFQNLRDYLQAKCFGLLTVNAFQDPKQVSKGQQIALSAIYGLAFGALGGGFGVPRYSEARKQELISDLQRLSPYADLIGINFSRGCALLRLAIDADDLPEDALVGRFSLIHEIAHDFRKYALTTITSNMGTIVEVLVIFSTHERAKDFTERVAQKCRHTAGFLSSMRGRVTTYPWVIDLERKEIVNAGKGFRKLWRLWLDFDNHQAALFRQRQQPRELRWIH